MTFPKGLRYFSIGQQRILLVLALLMLTFLYFRFYHKPSPSPEQTFKEFVVEVSGEVQQPGIYLFQKPPSLKETINRAGGFIEAVRSDDPVSSETLETGTLLFVQKTSDQQIKINIRRMEANKLLVFSIPLDLNRVSAEDLCLIPGIGESLAREILAYRERRKGFGSREDLKNVKGIGEKKYESVKRFFTVRSPP
jgi:competence protein ComEA